MTGDLYLIFNHGSVFVLQKKENPVYCFCAKITFPVFACISCQLGAYLVTHTENVDTFHGKLDILQPDYCKQGFLEAK